ncbi:MAG: primosomal protein N', partial [Bacteroidales bacterium]|nr:primosomal protein N' [Bacteroidales bacterium]
RELLADIKKTLAKGEQVLVFRSRRAYSPVVQCPHCGDIPKCPKCNVPLSYHKYNNTLECHYCGWHTPFTGICQVCGAEGTLPRGSGTEKLEEELREYFPEARVERFDAQTTAANTAEKEMLEAFADGRIDILVGTQMITKGFDFAKLTLVAVVQADSLFSIQDFRADERALQLLVQLRGRAGRRDLPGRMAIQTDQPDHPVLQRLAGKTDARIEEASLAERKMFSYPPFVRLVVITVKDRSEGRLWHLERDIRAILQECGVNSVLGPVKPPVEKIDNRLISQFWLKLPRNRSLALTKNILKVKLDALRLRYGAVDITVDVDPQ